MARTVKSKLTPYRGKAVNKTSLQITNAGDGLSQALDIEPLELEPGQTYFVVLKCKAGQHVHKLTKDEDEYVLKQQLVAGTSVMVDAELVQHVIDEQEERNEQARLIAEQAKGVHRLPWNQPADNADELVAHHEAGEHADALKDGCPNCIAERIAAEDERPGRRRRGKAAE